MDQYFEEVVQQQEPSLLDRRWKAIKTEIYKLVSVHKKFEILISLIRLRENHTAAPTLSEITNFTGYDIAIKTIQGWDWEPSETDRNLEAEALEIGKYGAELMVVHTIRESIKNQLLTWNGSELQETEGGKIHFQALNSFNVDITGSSMDIAKKRFTQSRLTKNQRIMDPVNQIPIVKHLYWENSIIMLLRAPLPFYQAMSSYSSAEIRYLLDLHSKLVSKSFQNSSGVVRVRLKKSSKAVSILEHLVPPQDKEDRRPRFVSCIKDPYYKDNEKVEYHIGLGSLTMFSMFLLGFDRDLLNEKANRAERAVREVIEHSGYWRVVESNIEVREEGGDVITEIDIVAKSQTTNQWIACEVKDFSFWKGWIFGHGTESRKEYYKKAVEKIPVKENFIIEKYGCEDLISLIITSIPEPNSVIDGIRLIYMSDLYEELAKLSNMKYTPRKRHHSSNFLIRYFERIQTDYENADNFLQPIEKLNTHVKILRDELYEIKKEYEHVRILYKRVVSEHDTLLVSEKLSSKRLLRDTGEKHYQLENDLTKIRGQIKKIRRERKIKAKALRELKEKYNDKLEIIKIKEKEIEKLESSIDRLLSPRLF